MKIKKALLEIVAGVTTLSLGLPALNASASSIYINQGPGGNNVAYTRDSQSWFESLFSPSQVDHPSKANKKRPNRHTRRAHAKRAHKNTRHPARHARPHRKSNPKPAVKPRPQIKVNNDNQARNKINNQVNHMSLQEKIGQCVMADLGNSNSSADYYARTYHLGGVMLDGENFWGIPNRWQFINHLRSLQNARNHSLLVSTDEEGGSVDRLALNPYIFDGYYWSPKHAYYSKGMWFVHKQYGMESNSLRNLGINMNLAPVVGMPNSNDNLYPRGVFQNANKQSWYASRAVNGIQGNNFSNHVSASTKHFPGFTNEANTDFHNGSTNESLNQMRNYNFKPFESAIKANTGSIMSSFITPHRITGNTPTAFSSYMINNILKNQLHYNGVILTDDLTAYASRSYADKQGCSPEYLALKSGNSMIMTEHPTRVGWLVNDAKHGDFNMNMINNDVKRNLFLKYKLGLNY